MKTKHSLRALCVFHVPPHSLKPLCEPENNYAIYRAEIKDLEDSDFYIPALGVLLKDVAAIVEAVPNKV